MVTPSQRWIQNLHKYEMDFKMVISFDETSALICIPILDMYPIWRPTPFIQGKSLTNQVNIWFKTGPDRKLVDKFWISLTKGILETLRVTGFRHLYLQPANAKFYVPLAFNSIQMRQCFMVSSPLHSHLFSIFHFLFLIILLTSADIRVNDKKEKRLKSASLIMEGNNEDETGKFHQSFNQPIAFCSNYV